MTAVAMLQSLTPSQSGPLQAVAVAAAAAAAKPQSTNALAIWHSQALTQCLPCSSRGSMSNSVAASPRTRRLGSRRPRASPAARHTLAMIGEGDMAMRKVQPDWRAAA